MSLASTFVKKSKCYSKYHWPAKVCLRTQNNINGIVSLTVVFI